MKALHNIEKSAFRRGEYIGHVRGEAWSIRKTNSTFGNWIAIKRDGPPQPNIYAFTLAALSEKLNAE